MSRPTTPRTGRYANNGRHSSSIGDVMKHYDDPDRLYNITVPRNNFLLGGYQLHDPAVPRGKNGLDAMEADQREADRLRNEQAQRAARQKQVERALDARAELDDQLADKVATLERTRAEQLEGELTALQQKPFGPYHDERKELEWKKRRQAQLRAALEKQKHDKAMRDALEAQHLAAPMPDWESGLKELDDRIRKAKMGDTTSAVPLNKQDGGESSNKPRVIADMRESAVKDKQEEVQPLSREVANFADRILLSEIGRRENRERYRSELDEQVQQNFKKRQNDLTMNLIIDRSYHVGALQRGIVSREELLDESTASSLKKSTPYVAANAGNIGTHNGLNSTPRAGAVASFWHTRS